jgi:hypothetical protein
MQQYRFYVVKHKGRADQPVLIATLPTDEMALRIARSIGKPDKIVEVWNSIRRVASIPPSEMV